MVVQIGVEQTDRKPTANVVAQKREQEVFANLQHIDTLGLFQQRRRERAELATTCS